MPRKNHRFNSELFNAKNQMRVQKRLANEKFYTDCADGDKPLLSAHIHLTPSEDELLCFVTQIFHLCTDKNATLTYKPLATLGCDKYSGSSQAIACDNASSGSLLSSNATCVNDNVSAYSTYPSQLYKTIGKISSELEKQNIPNYFDSFLTPYDSPYNLYADVDNCQADIYINFCNKYTPEKSNFGDNTLIILGSVFGAFAVGAIGLGCCLLLLYTCNKILQRKNSDTRLLYETPDQHSDEESNEEGHSLINNP